MIALNDYLYSGNTVLKILHQYEQDLRNEVENTHDPIELAHCGFLHQITNLLERNDFLTYQSQRIREFYKLMAREYPFLAFTFHGRIKSLIRAEGKFNGYIIEKISDYYSKYGELPPEEELLQKLKVFRDLIAYRIVLSLPECHLEEGEDPQVRELDYLYQIAEKLPAFMSQHGFEPEKLLIKDEAKNDSTSRLSEAVRPYYKDYEAHPTPSGYRSLHITFFDSIANSYIEFQLRTKSMDDYATIGPADHLEYERQQDETRSRRQIVPEGLYPAFDAACKRQELLQNLELSKLRVNMFTAYSQELINDGCGLYRGRLITPYEHLSRFQNDQI